MKIILFVIFLFSNVIYADDIFDVAEKYNKTKKQVFSLESEKREMLSAVYALERKTKKIVEEKSKLNSKKIKLKRSLQKVSKQIIEIEVDLKTMTPQLQKRLLYTKKIQGMPWMYAFISSYSVADLDRMIKTFDNINEKEASMTMSYFSKLENLNERKKELNRIASEVVGLNRTITKKENFIKIQHEKKKIFLTRIEKSIKNNKRNLSKIKNKGQKLLKKSEFENLGLLFGTTFFDKKGNLPHPVKAPIRHFYELNKDLLQDNIELFHKGLFYSAKKGTLVFAVEAGRVKYSKHVLGMGNVVIIDHGGRYYSVYSNLHKIKVKKNAVVEGKQAIATVGKMHIQFGEGLYFEIRHFSEPEDPSKWLKNRNKSQLAGFYN